MGVTEGEDHASVIIAFGLIIAIASYTTSATTLVDVVVSSRNSGTLGITEPWVYCGAFDTSLHVAGVTDVGRRFLESERALVRDIARLGSLRGLAFAVPRLVIVQLIERLRVGDPG